MPAGTDGVTRNGGPSRRARATGGCSNAALVLAQKPGEEVTQTAHGSSLPRSGSGKRSSASRMSATMRRQPVRTKSPSWASVMPASRG